MYIIFRSNQLNKICNDYRFSVRKLGKNTADKLFLRLTQIKASDNLDVLYTLPGARCHKLEGDRKVQFAVTLTEPFRLIFELAGDSSLFIEDGRINNELVAGVEIVEIGNYH